MTLLTPGIHLLHKPVGPTSFSIVQQCMERLPTSGKRRPRICHGGTLDPFASGLLLILVEPATQLFDYLHGIPKVYEGTVQWGIETDNGDPLGKPVFRGDASSLSPTALDQALASFAGWTDQVPPDTSAKRVDGERAYEKAHRGEKVELPACQVYLHEAQWLSHDLPATSRLRITVRGGFYVRSLVRDLGRRLGCGAHLRNLSRQSIGPWTDPGPGNTPSIIEADMLPFAPRRILSDHEAGELRSGRAIPVGSLAAGPYRLPPGFPDPSAPIAGIHLGRLVHLLACEATSHLRSVAYLRRR